MTTAATTNTQYGLFTVANNVASTSNAFTVLEADVAIQATSITSVASKNAQACALAEKELITQMSAGATGDYSAVINAQFQELTSASSASATAIGGVLNTDTTSISSISSANDQLLNNAATILSIGDSVTAAIQSS